MVTLATVMGLALIGLGAWLFWRALQDIRRRPAPPRLPTQLADQPLDWYLFLPPKKDPDQ